MVLQPEPLLGHLHRAGVRVRDRVGLGSGLGIGLASGLGSGLGAG